ncbi:hypothetical protein GE09DRAFT_1282917 [Coniochaeta sp. 2T2.1]|nr:hypothetical protein GE09DRAFT_1282917 [Coniochaeta sp. 2T2.1]
MSNYNYTGMSNCTGMSNYTYTYPNISAAVVGDAAAPAAAPGGNTHHDPPVGAIILFTGLGVAALGMIIWGIVRGCRHHREKTSYLSWPPLALLGRQALAAWEVTPLVPEADIATFNITNYNTSVWQVVHIDLPPQKSQDISHGSSAAAPATLVDGDDCYKDGNNTAYCVITQDPSQCKLAVRIPSTPRPEGQEFRADGWIYTHNCDMDHIRGCRLKQNRDGNPWSIYSDLKYTVEMITFGNRYPVFEYAGWKCNGSWCLGWSYILDDVPNKGPSVYVYRHSFPCNHG